VYWQNQVTRLEQEEHDFKLHQLPLARIKKVMKADPEVKMISAEAPILFAKGCDIFITELTMRAWIHAEENKRRTLQRSDIASALSKSDMFDFLIDIVPREEGQAGGKRSGTAHHGNAAQQAAAAAQMGAHGAVQQAPGVYPHGQVPEYATDPHMGQPGIYAAPVGGQMQQPDAGPGAYGQHPQQVNDPAAFGMYQYPLPQQVRSSQYRPPL
jgi:nuclear transcription factor Y gamma